MRHWFITSCCLVLSSFTLAAQATDDLATPQPSTLQLPAPFKSQYKVYRNGSEVGKGERTFYTSPDGRLYFSSESKLNWFVLNDYRKEQSWLRVDGERIRPLEYQYDRTGTGPDKFCHLIFNDQEQSLRELKSDYPLAMAWQPDLYDHLGYQLQLRMDVAQGKSELSYSMVNKGKLKTYTYEVVGEEVIKLPIGQINTVKLRIVRDEQSSRETLVWLSKEHDYALARLWQAQDGKEQADLQLASYQLLDH